MVNNYRLHLLLYYLKLINQPPYRQLKKLTLDTYCVIVLVYHLLKGLHTPTDTSRVPWEPPPCLMSFCD